MMSCEIAQGGRALEKKVCIQKKTIHVKNQRPTGLYESNSLPSAIDITVRPCFFFNCSSRSNQRLTGRCSKFQLAQMT